MTCTKAGCTEYALSTSSHVHDITIKLKIAHIFFFIAPLLCFQLMLIINNFFLVHNFWDFVSYRLHLAFEHLIGCGMSAASGHLFFLKTVLNLLEKASR